MQRIVSKIILSLFCVLVVAVPGRAARDVTAQMSPHSNYQLLVLEVAQCIYCRLFRRDVLPTYKATQRSKSLPMRFVDLDHSSLSAFKLQKPIETVPTVILLHSRREVGRLAGYMGPETFLHALNHLLSKAP